MGQKPTITTSCHHCGEPCAEETVQAAGHQFCCTGCATVFRILDENGLGDFYKLEEEAGRSRRGQTAGDYLWLDDKALVRPYLKFKDEQYSRVQVELPDIHCVSCLWLLERMHKIDPGIKSVQVDFARKQAQILFAHADISLRQLAELLERIGYPPHFSPSSEDRRPNSRRLQYQIGLAGFAFGNIMLFSFPEYLGLGSVSGEEQFGRWFSWLNLLLILPVLLYSGQDYFRSAWRALRAGGTNVDLPISLGILALFSQSVYEVFTASGPGYFDSLAGLLFFLLVGRWFQAKTFARLRFDRDYRDYFPVAASRIMPDGSLRAVKLDELDIGQRLLVKAGGLIPVDGILRGEQPVSIDYSFVTGEQIPQQRQPNERLQAGGRSVDTALEMEVSAGVDQSYLLGLWREQGELSDSDQTLTDKLSGYFTAAILTLASLTAIYWWIYDADLALYAAASVLIIACPCALALAIPFTYGTAIRLLGSRGLYLRETSVIDRIRSCRQFVFDKTGTLSPKGGRTVEPLYADWTDAVLPQVLGISQSSAHPSSRALALYLQRKGVKSIPLPWPVHEQRGAGLSAGPYRIGQAAFCGLDHEDLPAGTQLCVARQGKLLAAFGQLEPEYRSGWRSAMEGLARRGELHLLSGDYAPVAPPWSAIIPESNSQYRADPFEKKAYIDRLLREESGGVMMLGDGLNDTAALRAATVGIAVSEDEAEFAPASDAILSGKQLGRLHQMIDLVWTVRRVLVVAYAAALIYNLVGLSFAVSGRLEPVVAAILMPLSSITIVLIGFFGMHIAFYFSDLRKN